MQSRKKKTKNRRSAKSDSKKSLARAKLTVKFQDSPQKKVKRKAAGQTKRTSQAKIKTSQSLRYQVLLKSDEKYRTLIEQSLQGIVVIQDFRIIFANTAITKISGYTKKELLSFSPEQMRSRIYPEDQMFVWGHFRDRLAGEPIPPHQEYRIKRKDGTLAWIETFATLIQYGEKPAIQATLIDITSRKQAEERLLESEKKYRTLVESAQEGIGITDPDENILFINQAFANMLGYQREKLLGLNLKDISDKEEFRGFRIETEKRRKGESSRYEAKLYTQAGEARYFSISATPLFDKQGVFTGTMGLLLDITERKQAEDALRESEEKFRNLAEQSPNMIFINKKGRVVYANKKCQEIMGFTRKEFYSPDFDFFKLILPEYKDLIKVNFNSHLKGEEVAPNEYSFTTKDGEKIEAILTTKLIRYEGENAILGTVTDITERKRAEKEIQKLNEGLKLQAQELAAANKELEAFSYSVSHDLHAPLRTIDGFSRALLEDYGDKLNQTGKDYLRRVRTGTQQMRQLIDNLLNLSLAIRAQIRREETNLSELVQRIAADLEKSQPERQVQFVIQDRVFAHGDSQLLQDMLTNLLNNAWKFTEKHSRARIEFGATRKEEQMVYFVRDNGAGFDMTYVDKLFIPFQRLHSTDEFSGEGIGLAIAKRIINRHGGRIWAEGKVKKGATFFFTLP